MVTIEYDHNFKKHFNKRILPHSNLLEKFNHRLDLFIKDQSHPMLRDHRLIGKLNQARSFSITGDIRIIYLQIKPNHFIFLDIGTHNQVYR